MFIVYIIENGLGKRYIGQTSDIEKRLQRHNNKLSHNKKSFTYKAKGMWKTIYQEKFPTRSEALKREKELKSYRGRQSLKNILDI